MDGFDVMPNGEEGHRKGLDFERSTAAMLTCLGFKIVAENIRVECLDPSNHTKNPHEIDLLIQHVGPLPRPFTSHDGLTYLDCTTAENLSADYFQELSEAVDCLRKDSRYTDTKGAIFATDRRLTSTVKDSARRSGMICWDLDRLSLYGSLAELFPLRGHTHFHPEGSTIFAVYEPITYVPRQIYAGLYSESDERFNRDCLADALLCLRKLLPLVSITDVSVHSLSGFTSDVPMILDDLGKECGSRVKRIKLSPERLYDHTRPWFPALSQRSS
jgi:hypothetical protein